MRVCVCTNADTVSQRATAASWPHGFWGMFCAQTDPSSLSLLLAPSSPTYSVWEISPSHLPSFPPTSALSFSELKQIHDLHARTHTHSLPLPQSLTHCLIQSHCIAQLSVQHSIALTLTATCGGSLFHKHTLSLTHTHPLAFTHARAQSHSLFLSWPFYSLLIHDLRSIQRDDLWSIQRSHTYIALRARTLASPLEGEIRTRCFARISPWYIEEKLLLLFGLKDSQVFQKSCNSQNEIIQCNWNSGFPYGLIAKCDVPTF